MALKYFWYWQPDRQFPPPAVIDADGSTEADRLNIACTQTNHSAKRQKQIVDAWCERLPKLTDVRLLWLTSRVPSNIYSKLRVVCQNSWRGLYICEWAQRSVASSRMLPVYVIFILDSHHGSHH